MSESDNKFYDFGVKVPLENLSEIMVDAFTERVAGYGSKLKDVDVLIVSHDDKLNKYSIFSNGECVYNLDKQEVADYKIRSIDLCVLPNVDDGGEKVKSFNDLVCRVNDFFKGMSGYGGLIYIKRNMQSRQELYEFELITI
ncbi:MAG: hypothetical protein WC758_00015 [Candidatus Woesearchaeota archaeon]|jgi:hypothetical protein